MTRRYVCSQDGIAKRNRVAVAQNAICRHWRISESIAKTEVAFTTASKELRVRFSCHQFRPGQLLQ